MENKIKFEISRFVCRVCKDPIVEEFSLVYGEHNGIFGPGGYAPSWIESEFYCLTCGIQYKPTEKNNLAKGCDLRKQKAEKILRTTGRVSLKRNLKRGEVFEICKNPEAIKSYSLYGPLDSRKDEFSEGDFLRTLYGRGKCDVESMISMPFEFEKPFIVFGKTKSKLVFWAPNKSYWVRKSKKSLLAEKKSGGTSKTQKILDTLALEGNTKVLRYKKTRPLPEGSVEAIEVFCESMGYERSFYIPKDAI